MLIEGVKRQYRGEMKPAALIPATVLALAVLQFALAEDVEKMNPGLVARDREGKPYSVRYEVVNAMLLNEFIKEHRQVEQMQEQIDALAAGLQTVSAALAAADSVGGGLEASTRRRRRF